MRDAGKYVGEVGSGAGLIVKQSVAVVLTKAVASVYTYLHSYSRIYKGTYDSYMALHTQTTHVSAL